MENYLQVLKERNENAHNYIRSLNGDDLINEFAATVLNLMDMEARVQVFMNECTNMSNTNYTIDVIKELIKDAKEDLLGEFCADFIEDADSYDDETILAQIRKIGVEHIDKYS